MLKKKKKLFSGLESMPFSHMRTTLSVGSRLPLNECNI